MRFLHHFFPPINFWTPNLRLQPSLFPCLYCFDKPYPSPVYSIYTCLSLHPFNCTRNYPHHYLTKCRSYRLENSWIQNSLSRRCPDFLVFLVLMITQKTVCSSQGQMPVNCDRLKNSNNELSLRLINELGNMCRSCFAQLNWTRLAWLKLFIVTSCVTPTGVYLLISGWNSVTIIKLNICMIKRL